MTAGVQVGRQGDDYVWWCPTCESESGWFSTFRAALGDAEFHDCDDDDDELEPGEG